MSRIPTPATLDAAPEAARPLLEAVSKQLGSVPNLFRLVANSPATLEGYLGLNGALGRGQLPLAVREGIALAVAEANGCGYCLAAHSYLGSHLAKLPEAEMAKNRAGLSSDPKAAAAINLALTISKTRGKVGPEDLASARAAGWSDAALVEIVGHVALNTLTNYVNEVFGTDIDFPAAAPLAG